MKVSLPDAAGLPSVALTAWQALFDLGELTAGQRVLVNGAGGVVGVEHADVQGDAVPAVLAATGRWAEVRDHRDLADRPRFVTARLAR